MIMEEMLYRVVRIDGDYAVLTRLDPSGEQGGTNAVALALLPDNLREGDVLIRRLLEYERCE